MAFQTNHNHYVVKNVHLSIHVTTNKEKMWTDLKQLDKLLLLEHVFIMTKTKIILMKSFKQYQ